MPHNPDCYVCQMDAPCQHERPIGRPRAATGRWVGGKWVPGASKVIPSRVLGDKDAKAEVLPNWPTFYSDGSGGEWAAKDASRWPDGTLMVRSDGSGTMHGPKVETISGDAVARYLALVPHPSEGALKGRDWKTGRIGA